MADQTVETKDTTQVRDQTAAVETKDTTQGNAAEQTNSFIDSIMESGRELAPPGGGTTKVETVQSEEKKAAAKETTKQKTAESQETDTAGKSVITLNVNGKPTPFDISTDEGLESAKQAVTDGFVIVEKEDGEWQYDLNNENDVDELRKIYGEAGESQAESDNIFELKIKDGQKDGKDTAITEKYDISKKEDREKILQFAQKGRFVEKELSEFKQEKEVFQQERTVLSDISAYVGYNILNQQAGGKLTQRDFMNLPYEDFIGASEKTDKDGNVIEEATAEGDRALWNAHNQNAEKKRGTLQEYEKNIRKTAEGFKAMREKFAADHPEISDIDAWIKDNMGPYHSPVVSYGNAPYPEDTFEMIYFWKNKDSIIKEAEERGRRTAAKAKVERNTQTTKISSGAKPMQKVDKVVNKMFGEDVEIAR